MGTCVIHYGEQLEGILCLRALQKDEVSIVMRQVRPQARKIAHNNGYTESLCSLPPLLKLLCVDRLKWRGSALLSVHWSRVLYCHRRCLSSYGRSNTEANSACTKFLGSLIVAIIDEPTNVRRERIHTSGAVAETETLAVPFDSVARAFAVDFG